MFSDSLIIRRPHSLMAFVKLMKDCTAKRLLLYNIEPTALHRQNLIEVGFPVPQLKKLGPAVDSDVPLAMRVDENVRDLQRILMYPKFDLSHHSIFHHSIFHFKCLNVSSSNLHINQISQFEVPEVYVSKRVRLGVEKETLPSPELLAVKLEEHHLGQ